MRVWGKAHSARTGLATAALLTFSLSGCAAFSDWMSFGDSDEKLQADKASLWEMTIMAGRYGVMLDQAREILNLPEPKALAGEMFPTADEDYRKQLDALAAYQAKVTNEFLADTAQACKRKRVPARVRSLACDQQKKVPAALRTPAVSDMPTLSARNDQVGNVVMPWWESVCALAPKPKEGDVPACAME